MHSFFNRVQSAASSFSTIVLFVSIVVACMSWLQLYASGASHCVSRISNVQPKVTLRTSRRFGSTGAPKENARISFDLDVDLTPLFNWNTKQVFVYLAADYDGLRSDVKNSVTFWDMIIPNKKDAVLKLKNQRGKYSVWDTSNTLAGRNATIKLKWNVQPHVGFLSFGETLTKGDPWFVFPSPEK